MGNIDVDGAAQPVIGGVEPLPEKAYIAAAEAVMFAYGEPVELKKLAAALEVSEERAEYFTNLLRERYDECESGLRVVKLGGSYQITTRIECAEFIKNAMTIKKQTPLTQAAIECLALVAYNQPVTKGFIEKVRGIDSGSVVNTLVEKGLAEEYGRLDLPGRPIAYKTTDNFLRCFGLSSISSLPQVEEAAAEGTA